MTQRLTHLTLACAALLLLSFRPAHAYIDPGTGSYIFQIVIASVVAGVFVFKSLLLRLVAFLTGKMRRVPKDENHDV